MARSLARASAGQLGLGGLDVGLGLLGVGGGTHHFELRVGPLLALRLPQLGDLFQRLVLGLRHEGDHAEEAQQVGSSEHQEGAHAADGADQHRGELADGPAGAPQEHGADTGGAATQIGGEELRDHNPRNRAHGEGEAGSEAHHEDEHEQLVVVRVGEGDAKHEQHHEAGADRYELLTAGGINQVHAHHGEHELDAAPSPYGPLNETLWQIVVKPLSFIQIAPSHLHD